jgi:hypothetical protein
MGDDRAFGLACRSGSVHDGRDVIERDLFASVERLRPRDCSLIGAVRSEQQGGFDVAEFRDVQRGLGEIGVVNHQRRRSVAGDELQLRNGQPRIERHEDRADPPAGELDLQRIGRVQRQHCDAVTARNIPPVAQMRGEAGDALIEFGIAEPAFARKIDDGRLVRRASAKMRYPVVMPNRHSVLPD